MLKRPRLIAIALLLAALPLMAAKCSTQSPWGAASAGRHATVSDGVMVRVGTYIRNGKRVGKFLGVATGIAGGIIIGNAAKDAINQKDPCVLEGPQYVVAKFKSKQNSEPAYLDCRTLYPMMKSGGPYTQMSFSISCISQIIATGKYTVNLPTTERWQAGHLHVVVAVSNARIKRYSCT